MNVMFNSTIFLYFVVLQLVHLVKLIFYNKIVLPDYGVMGE